MKAARLGPIQLDLCFPCSGVWFDYGELQQLVQAGPSVIRKLGQRLFATQSKALKPDNKRCPVCWVPLGAYEFPSMKGIALDHCTLCQGFWVSLESLGQVLIRLEAATATRDLPPPGPVRPAPPIIPREPERAPAAVAPPSNGATPGQRVHTAKPAPAAAVPQTPSHPVYPARFASTAPPVPATVAQSQVSRPPGAVGTRPAPVSSEAAPKPAGRKCASCQETNAPGAAVCWACGGFLRPEGAGPCPGCAALLQREECDGVEVGYCESCGGVWLESDRLTAVRSKSGIYQEQMLDRMRVNIAGNPPLAEQPACPKCRTTLMPEDLGILSSEPMLTCPKCWGSYLENGRLGEILFGRFV
jgi:Zn-finger nucleic acid-binding protein